MIMVKAITGQMAQEMRRLPLVREGSTLELMIKSPTRCQRLATALNMLTGQVAQEIRRLLRCVKYGVQLQSRSILQHVANDSTPLQI